MVVTISKVLALVLQMFISSVSTAQNTDSASLSHLNGLHGKELCLIFESRQIVAKMSGEEGVNVIKNNTIVIDSSLGSRGFFIQVPNRTTSSDGSEFTE